jgi:hypothetical protein
MDHMIEIELDDLKAYMVVLYVIFLRMHGWFI